MKVILLLFICIFLTLKISTRKTKSNYKQKKHKSQNLSLPKKKYLHNKKKQKKFLHNKTQKKKRNLDLTDLASSNLSLPGGEHPGLEDEHHINSGQIKLGEGADFDTSGNEIEEGVAGGGGGGAGGGMPRFLGNSIGGGGHPLGSDGERFDFTQPTIKDQTDDQPAYISFPDQVMAPSYKQGPIIFSPQILYPSIKKRMIIHHEKGFKKFYKDTLAQSHYWVNFANMNPYYKNMMSKFEVHKFPYHKELADLADKKQKEMLEEMLNAGGRRII